MISALYAVLAALWMVHLSFGVIRLRREHLVSLGDGDNEALRAAIAAQTNAAEYIPIILLLLFAVEMNGVGAWFIHLCGIALLVGRVIHAQAIYANNIENRVVGMKITFNTLFILVAGNIVYFPYSQLLSFF